MSCYVDLLIKTYQLEIFKKGDYCVIEYFHAFFLQKTNPCRIKVYEKCFENLMTKGLTLNEGIFVKDILISHKIKKLGKNDFELDKNRTYLPVFLPLL